MPAPALAAGYPLVTPHPRTTVQRESLIHRLALALVAITIVSGGIVFSEPAPVDALTIGLIVLLPTIGLVAINPTLIGYVSLWSVAGAAAVFAATLSLDLPETLMHVSITLYLYVASAVFAAFVANNPIRHTELIFKAWTWGAVIAAATAIIGYFDLLPGSYDLFTKFDRASGTFKDPNVLGPFLVAPTLYMLHVALTRPWHRMLPPLAVAGMLALALLLTFSRGAWMNSAVALGLYGYLTFLTSDRASTRLKLFALLTAALIFLAGIVALAATSDSVSNMIEERSSLAMSYDVGSEGRFGGQQKAIALIIEHPLGIGAQEFATRHHSEEAHNVYLSILLDAGWLGGGIYWILVGLTIVLGMRHALKPSPARPLFLIAYSAFVANALEGLIVDTDHWRHFYLLLAIVWGLMSAAKVAEPMVRAAIPARRLRAIGIEPPVRWPQPRQRLPGILPRMLRERS